MLPSELLESNHLKESASVNMLAEIRPERETPHPQQTLP